MPKSILSTVGNTPLVELHRVIPGRVIHAKLEMFNPTGSAKDRAGLSMIRDALDRRLVEPGGTVIESSSGNMGLALAQACGYYKIRFLCIVDERTSSRTLELLRAYGAEVEIVRREGLPTEDMLGLRLDRIKALRREIEGVYWTNQYANPANPAAHRQTMEEIVEAIGPDIDYMFIATSTCGTLAGCVDYARERRMATKFVAVDARGSVTFNGELGPRKLPGHGISREPQLYKRVEALAGDCCRVSDFDCVEGCRWLRDSEAILAGASSGGVVAALRRNADRIPAGAKVAVIFHDRGDRYINTIYCDEWVGRLGV